MPRGMAKQALSLPNRVAAGTTLVAVLTVALWASRPVDGAMEFGLGSSGRSRAQLSPLHVPVRFEGFYGSEPWGRWTEGDTAHIRFGRPVPADFRLVVRGRAFGPNVDAPVRVCVEDECQLVRLAAQDRRVQLEFRGHGGARRVTFHIPHPSSPGNGDDRQLGIGIVSLRVEDAAR